MIAQLAMRLNNRRTTQLTIYYHDTGQCTWQSYQVFSGAGEHRNNPNSTNLQEQGPIPRGRYYVVDRPTGGRRDWIRSNIWDFDGRLEWFALFRIDGHVNDHTVVDGVRRGNFRMHPGTVSVGCVTFVRRSDFDDIRQILTSQTAETVPNSNLSYYGILTVS